MTDGRLRTAFVRMFASAVAMQAVLSATSLMVGLILIRRAPSQEYGYYVLIVNLTSLAVGVRNQFIQPQMVLRLVRGNSVERADLIGGLFRAQLQLWWMVTVVAVVTTLVWRALGSLPWRTVFVAFGGIVAIVGSLYREFFRMVLLSYRRSEDVLKADAVYAVLLISGALLATLTPLAATAASVTMALSAAIGGALCARALWRHEPWRINGSPGIMREIAPAGIWSTSGNAIHWLLSQGYNFLVAGIFDASAVASLAATRLLIMPVNLVSTGIGTLMLPTTTEWLDAHGSAKVLRRLLLITGGLSIVAVIYFSALWMVRDWVFTYVLKKEIVQRDQLILLWFAIGLMMLVRDQLLYLGLARARYPSLTFITLISAMVSLTVSFVGMHRIGIKGALYGVLCGEVTNVLGLLVLSIVESRRGSGGGRVKSLDGEEPNAGESLG